MQQFIFQGISLINHSRANDRSPLEPQLYGNRISHPDLEHRSKPMQATRLYIILLVSFFFSATASSLVAQTIPHAPLCTFHGGSAENGCGHSASGVGDVNSDGTPDLIVGVSGEPSSTFSQTLGHSESVDSDNFVLSLPSDAPREFEVAVEFRGQRLTLKLEKNSVYGENTRFLVDDGTGALVKIDAGLDRSYLGTVVEEPEFAVSALLTREGLVANIIRPNQESLTIQPVRDLATPGHHEISLAEVRAARNYGHDGNHEHGDEHERELLGQELTAASTDTVTTGSSGDPPVLAMTASSATLTPLQIVPVLEYEIGVEIGSRAFFGSPYNGNLATAQASAASTIGNLDARYLHATGIKFKLGTVIIRTDASTDPLRNSVTSTGATTNANSSLSAFRNYWNNNPDEVGDTHDLAVYHVLSAPSGLAYVNSVGSSNRYATCGGNGATSWADGTLVHEFGHSWNLRHTNDSGLFYEARPRVNSGSNSPGGRDDFISVMHGSGNHNIGRLATEEAEVVLAARSSRTSFGTPFTPAPVKPFGRYDVAFASLNPVTIDVIKNDTDVNNDVLDVMLLDTVSNLGGTISLSSATGPGGRNELIYTPPTNESGEDFFHYTVFDSSGRSDFGAVYVTVVSPTFVDPSLTLYRYDLGNADSPVFPDYESISPDSFGELGFTSNGPNPVESRDREENGQIPNVNDINRDLIRLRSNTTFHHRLNDGVYDILMTIGDATENSNPILFIAETEFLLQTANHVPTTFTNYVLEDVVVTDGELTLDIKNLGFSANITRLNITRVADVPSIVDLTATAYRYDLGTPNSPVFANYQSISHLTFGDLGFTSDGPNPVESADHPQNSHDISRDLIRLRSTSTFHHKVADGLYNVLISVGDATENTDPIRFTAEGSVELTTVSQAQGAFSNYTLQAVPVSDGELNIEIENLGIASNLTRLNITRAGDIVAEALLGDVNMDGVVNFLDISPFISILSSNGFKTEADVDENGVVNFLDISHFINILSSQ